MVDVEVRTFYPASLKKTFRYSWKQGKYVYFKTENELIRLLDVLRPSQCFAPTAFNFPISSTLTHALRGHFSRNLSASTLQTFNKSRTGDFFYLESPYMKAKRGTFENVDYFDVKSFYYVIHNQLIKHYDFVNTQNNLANCKKEPIDLKKYPKSVDKEGKTIFEKKEGYDLRENISDFFIEPDYQQAEVKDVSGFVNGVVSQKFIDILDKTILKKSRNLLSFGCFVEYNRRVSRMTPLHSFIPFVAKKIMERVNEKIKSFYSDTDCLMVTGMNIETAENLLQKTISDVNKNLFGFDLLTPEAFKIDSKGEFKRIHIFENKFYICEKQNGSFSWTFAGLPTPEHIPITAMISRSYGGWANESKFLNKAIEPSLGSEFDFDSFLQKLPRDPLIALRYFYLSQVPSETAFMGSFPHLAIPLDYSAYDLFSRLQQ